MESYSNLKKLSDKNNEVEFRAEVPLETVQDHEKRELHRLGKDFSMPGFRRGKIPEAMLRERISVADLIEATADSAVRAAIQEIAETEKLAAIGTPKVSIETLEPNKPIVFTVRFAIEPEVELPDYTTIGKEILSRKSDVSVTEKEIDDALLEIRRMTMQATGGKDLPELNDAFAEQLGGVKTLAALKDEVKRELLQGKENNIRSAQRNEAVKTIVQKSKLTVPELLMEQELAHFLEHRNAEFERLGMTLDAYLKEAKKTEKDLAKEDREMIEDRIRTSFVFRKIQETANITADDREIATHVNFLKHRYPNEDPRNLRREAEAAIIEGKIFKLFEPATKEAEKDTHAK